MELRAIQDKPSLKRAGKVVAKYQTISVLSVSCRAAVGSSTARGALTAINSLFSDSDHYNELHFELTLT